MHAANILLQMQPFHLGLDKHQLARIDQWQDTRSGSFTNYVDIVCKGFRCYLHRNEPTSMMSF